MTSRPVLIAAGGTGGHLFPARALAEELTRRGRALAIVTDSRGVDLGKGLDGIPVHRLHAAPMAGRSLIGRVSGAVDLLRGWMEARRLIASLDPAGIVGFGGYPTVPPMHAATRAGLPALIHEQNAVLGRANRMLAPRVSAVATSFLVTSRLPVDHAVETILTGNPVRADIAAKAEIPYCAPRPDGPLHILVIGGSQGARVLSEVVPDALATMPQFARRRISITQQCRPEDLEDVRRDYGGLGMEVELSTFFPDMAERLVAADLVISRAGASTVAELAAVGRPAILVPYPHAADDHQTANARAVESDGAAWVMAEPGFTGDALAAQLESLLANPDRLAEVAGAAMRRARLDAAAALADAVLRLMPGNGGNGTSGITERAA